MIENKNPFSETHFLVTDRNLDMIKKDIFKLRDEVLTWPTNCIVFVSGSGSYRAMEVELKAIRPDLRFISIDPTLGLEHSTHTIKKDVFPIIWYEPKKKNDTQTPEEFNEIQKERTNNIELPDSLAISATFPNLPFKTNSVEVFIDILGAFIYSSKGTEGAKENVTTLLRILKPGGIAYLTDIDIATRDILIQMEGIKVEVLSHNGVFMDEDYTEVQLREEYLKEKVPIPNVANIKVTKFA